MVSYREKLERMHKGVGLTIDWKKYRKVMKVLRSELEWTKEFRRSRADWSYIESRPERLRTALKVLVETGDLKGTSQAYSIPLEEHNEERIRAKIPIVVIGLKEI